MKSGLKIIMIIIILIGIVFSISNIVSTELKAGGMKGIWVYDFGTQTCEGLGNQCDITLGFEPNG